MKINAWESAIAFMIVLFGSVVAYFGSRYPIGTLGRMGAGYFPVALGILTVGLGVLTLAEVRKSDAPPPDVPWRAFLFVFLGVLVWALLVERIGLLPSSVLLIVISSLARSPVHPRTVVLTAAVASIAAVIIFINGFGLPFQVVKW